LLHQKLEKKIIGRASLLYHWKCSKQPSKPPLLLMGHQDVVPEGDTKQWLYPPFDGILADGCIWGRGSADCKYIIMGEMEAVEALIDKGFEPDYDIYLAYGHNEEVQAKDKGAKQIADYLKSKGVHLGAVFDEGSGPRQWGEHILCQVNMSEKASQDYEIYCESEGGHSMEPGQGTALGQLARAIVAIEDNPFPYRLTELVKDQLKAMSDICDEPHQKRVYSEPQKYWSELCEMARKDKRLDALLHTTCAVTMAQGSLQPNILPERASAIINCRVLEGDKSEDILKRIEAVIPPTVKIKKISGDETGKATKTDNIYFHLIVDIERERFGEHAVIIPGLLAGGTDARYYTEISDAVFRYAGFYHDNRWGMPHRANEKIPADVLESGVEFYKKILLKYNQVS
jgi:carboxypeptidase PM20D1